MVKYLVEKGPDINEEDMIFLRISTGISQRSFHSVLKPSHSQVFHRSLAEALLMLPI